MECSFKQKVDGFPGGKLPANAEDTGLNPDPGRAHMGG